MVYYISNFFSIISTCKFYSIIITKWFKWFKWGYIIKIRVNGYFPQVVNYTPMNIIFQFNPSIVVCKLRVTPNIFSKRNNLLVVNINISILILMVSDQWQTTTEWLHFHVLRWNDYFSSLALCTKQTILLKNDIVLAHL